jgi:hypothetical protein
MSLDRLLNSLTKVKGRKGSWTAACPSHADRSPSLSIRQVDDGRILMHCFGGCSVHDVLGAVGMEIGDLFPDNGETKKGVKPAFYATDLLRVIAFESLVVTIAALDMGKGKVLPQADIDRVMQAASRIQEAARYANV